MIDYCPLHRDYPFGAAKSPIFCASDKTPSFISWIHVSLMIISLAQRLGLNVVDIYLVGGSLRRKIALPNKDMDSVVVIKASHSLGELVKLRSYVTSRLCELGVDKWYHYKLLDIRELQRMSQYDGFRIREFQLVNYSLLNSKLIESLSPTLNTQSFASSIIIQTVYETHDPDCIEAKRDDIYQRLQKRLLRNAYIYGRLPETIIELWWNLRKVVFADNWTRIPSIVMDNYYSRFPHEFINKKSKYLINARHKQLRG